MHDYLTEWLLCPQCHGDLVWRVDEREGGHVESGVSRCTECDTRYPIRDGIGIFLLADLPREDLWQDVDNALVNDLTDNSEVERQLMDVPLESLGPADQFFRAMVLEERDQFDLAAEAEATAMKGIYTAEHRACSDSQVGYVLSLARQLDGPIVDLACGRGHLVERLVVEQSRLVVASDFSLKVLRRNRRWLAHLGLYDRVSLLAFDARRTPFRDGVVPMLTTYVGLPNIESPGELMVELRRVVDGVFAAVSHFSPPDDEANASFLREHSLETFYFKRSALDRFEESGWQIEVANSCHALARPTPTGQVIEGAGIDGFPVSETNLEWCVLVAS
jgi:uncharacterized protein YbaR (Trm112 family)